MEYRIGQFNDSFPPVMDGVALTVRNYAYWLNKTMGTTTVVTPKVPGYVDHEPFPIIRYPSVPLLVKPPYRIGLTYLDPFLHKNLRARNFDLVHAHTPFSSGLIALSLAKKNNIPIVATFHSKFREDFMHFIPSPTLVNSIIRGIVRFLDSVDEVWIPQESVAETIREYGYKGNYVVMENGTDFVATDNLKQYQESARRQLGLLPGQKLFLFVGQLTEEKNTPFLVRAISLLKDLDFRLIFVGVGYAKSELENLTVRLGVADKVQFLGAIYDRERLQSIYAAADLFLFPSLYDNAPLVLREAAAAQTPAVLLNGSTAGRVLEDGVNGFLSENTPQAYALKIREAITDPERLAAVGLEASRTVCRSWENIIAEVQERYVHLIERKK
jgi:glycosyltransferase involved in cell wall biosynthesis